MGAKSSNDTVGCKRRRQPAFAAAKVTCAFPGIQSPTRLQHPSARHCLRFGPTRPCQSHPPAMPFLRQRLPIPDQTGSYPAPRDPRRQDT
jgi:hypothetical protein